MKRYEGRTVVSWFRQMNFYPGQILSVSHICLTHSLFLSPTWSDSDIISHSVPYVSCFLCVCMLDLLSFSGCESNRMIGNLFSVCLSVFELLICKWL